MDEIPRENWRIVRADSEETVGVDGLAANAIDSDERTFWITNTQAADAPAYPHEIVIDLGGKYEVCGLRIVPRRGLGDPRDCEVFVTDDPEQLGAPVIHGYCPDNRPDRTILFEPKTGRYVCLRVLSGLHGSPYMAIREISLYTPKPELTESAE